MATLPESEFFIVHGRQKVRRLSQLPLKQSKLELALTDCHQPHHRLVPTSDYDILPGEGCFDQLGEVGLGGGDGELALGSGSRGVRLA